MAALLLDENVPRSAGRLLAAAGHDVVLAADIQPGADDTAVLALARSQQRVLVSFDADFGELIYLHRLPPPPAVLYLRLHPIDGPAAAALAEIALLAPVAGQFVVCSRDGVRRRPLPDDRHG